MPIMVLVPNQLLRKPYFWSPNLCNRTLPAPNHML